MKLNLVYYIFSIKKWINVRWFQIIFCSCDLVFIVSLSGPLRCNLTNQTGHLYCFALGESLMFYLSIGPEERTTLKRNEVGLFKLINDEKTSKYLKNGTLKNKVKTTKNDSYSSTSGKHQRTNMLNLHILGKKNISNFAYKVLVLCSDVVLKCTFIVNFIN